MNFPFRRTLQFPVRSPLSCRALSSLQGSRIKTIIQAPAPGLSLQAQQVSIEWTPLTPAIKVFHPPLHSQSAHCHPLRFRGIHNLQVLALDPLTTLMASKVPNSRLTLQEDLFPPLIMSWVQNAQAVTLKEVSLRAPQPTSHPAPARSTPPTTCWAHMTIDRWAASRLGQTEAPLRCLSILKCPVHSHEILVWGMVSSFKRLQFLYN